MNEIKTRRQAAEAGESKYFTGKPCKHGHDSPRYTCSGICCACNSSLAKSYGKRLARLVNNRAAGAFAYPLHPDDHAAALAYCQGLDLVRGRIPQSPGVVAAPQASETVVLPDHIAARRAELMREYGPRNNAEPFLPKP